MKRQGNLLNNRSSIYVKYIYRIGLLFLFLSGFAQMPIFKRYYIADMPGLGWLADFYATHFMHYLFAFILIALAAYVMTDRFLHRSDPSRITAFGYVKGALITGLILTGALLVVKNFTGTPFSPNTVFLLDVLHLALAVALLFTGLLSLVLRKKWIAGLKNG